jgi:hypothetical protein
MRHKEYIETCEICKKTYIATRKGSLVCGTVCRAQKSRDKRLKQFKTQNKVIRTQAKVIAAVLSKMANCEDCGKREKIERLSHIGIKKENSLLCYDCWNKRHSG